MKHTIYIKHWLSLKPEKYSGRTDLYYLKVANNINLNFSKSLSKMLSKFMSRDDRSLFCCFLTCYFEDIISETNIWNSFRHLHQELYNKPLPFYTIDDDYIEEEVNFEDVAFLTWYFLNTIQKTRFVSPYNDFIKDVATFTMQILDEEFEYAPENVQLKKRMSFDGESKELYEVRHFMQTVFFDSYLFRTDIKQAMDEEILETVENIKGKEPDKIQLYINVITQDYTFNKTSALLALKAKDWTKTLLGKTHSSYDDIANISNKISGLFLYKKQNSTSVFLEHIASGMLFEMTKESFDHGKDLKPDCIVYIGLVNYKNEWWFSGNFFQQNFDADLILDQKNSAEARSHVNFLNDAMAVESILIGQEKAFLKFNGGKHIAYLRASEVERFSKDYMAFYNDGLKLSSQEKSKADKRMRADGYFPKEGLFEDISSDEEGAIIFFNPKNGIEIYFDILNAFPDENNPFFTSESREDIMQIMMAQDISVELVCYFIDNFKDKLDFFKNEPTKDYLDDMDFLLRFWKKDSYVTKTNMILMG